MASVELDYLRSVVASIVRPYQALSQTKAILSIGSTSYGVADRYSDIDLALYYDDLPSSEQLESAMRENGCDALNWVIGDRAAGYLIESYLVNGIECQFAHSTLAAWSKNMDLVLVDFDVESPMQKALSGVPAGVPLYGDEIIAEFKTRVADYPAGLARKMVEKHLSVQHLWAFNERLKVRDGLLWKQQALVEGAQNILGVLAGLNRLYFSTFQFKRMSAFIDEMKVKPERLGVRIESLFSNTEASAETLKALFEETADLVEAFMPEVDTSGARALLARTERQWSLPD